MKQIFLSGFFQFFYLLTTNAVSTNIIHLLLISYRTKVVIIIPCFLKEQKLIINAKWNIYHMILFNNNDILEFILKILR